MLSLLRHIPILLLSFVVCDETEPIVCSALSYGKVRVVWQFQLSHSHLDDDHVLFYDVSWFYREDFDAVKGSDVIKDFRDYVDYEYENELNRYDNDGLDYDVIIEDLATAFGLSSFDYIAVVGKNHVIIDNLHGNKTLDVSVRGFWKDPDVTRGVSPEDNPYLRCVIKLPGYVESVTSPPTDQSELDTWRWFVIIPGSFLTLIVALFVLLVIYRSHSRKRICQSPVNHFATSWNEDSHTQYRHYVVTAEDCWTPSTLDGVSTEYNSSFADSDTYGMFHYRHSLTTVTEEPDVEEQRKSKPINTKKIVARQHAKYRQGTPQTPRSTSSRSRTWAPSRSSRLSDLGSTSLWWSEDESEADDVIMRRRCNRLVRERKHRQVAPLEKELSDVTIRSSEETTWLLHRNVNKAPTRTETPAVTSRRRDSYCPGGRSRLHQTKSTLNIFPV
ncbi:unnamed protein product [Clavelina lepadiformis]|uniref:Uncharacterized protein n=1 Tax=Clavelina lepadiformis TaxID=159417 RepID=A0ABP0FV84_CLALP